MRLQKEGKEVIALNLRAASNFLKLIFFLSCGGSFVLRTKCMREAADV